MFKNEYQGGLYFEIFSAQGKDPVTHWKLSSPGIKKSFDKEVKSFVFTLEGSAATTKMQLPKDSKQTLCLVQRFLILQVSIPKGQDFAIDLGVADSGNSKRRLVLSTTYKEIQSNPLHAKVPMSLLKKSIWLNLCLDLESLVCDTWNGQTYKSIESICISGNCRLRRIFTMKNQPADTTDDEDLYGFNGTNNTKIDMIPRQCQLAPDVPQQTQVINVMKVKSCENKLRGGGDSGNDFDLSSSGGHKSNQENYHIAFGTKVPGHRKSTSREGSGTSRQSKASIRSRSESEESNTKNTSISSNPTDSRDRKNSDPGTNEFDPEVSVDKDSLRSSHTWTDGADNKEEIPFVRPHPPSQPSSGSRRKPRVKSAGKERGLSYDGMSNPSSNCSSAGSLRQKYVLASADEEQKFLKEMQKLSHREMKSGSESDLSSQNTSGVHDDSISDVISTLKARDQEVEGDDENTGEGSEEDEKSMYLFSSPPKSAKVKKSYSKGHRTRLRKKSNEFLKLYKKDSRGAKPETDFVSGEANSSDEESIGSRVLTKQYANNQDSSQTRMSISKKSLREIPKDEVRRSGGQKAYNFAKYQMADLSDSFEAQMLLSMQRDADFNSDEDSKTPRADGKGLSRLHYKDEDSSDDTSMSTLKSPSSVKQKPHNYQDEMVILSNTFLSQSNPRDWGNVFSPPIVLPKNHDDNEVLCQMPLEINKPDSKPSSGSRVGSERNTDTDGEEELDLLYDPVLNCYYDPKTCKYYELT